MKIRDGFVSNSSSSSFMIYGMVLEDGTGDYNYNKLNEKIHKLKLNLEVECPPDDNFYVGRSWDEIGDDETGKQFKKSVEADLHKLLAGEETIEFGSFSMGWYDG